MFKLLVFLMAGGALTASASTITFQPTFQTINLGATATVDIGVSGLSVNQAIGAFDVLVLSNAAIIAPTSVTFFSALGVPSFELTGDTFTSNSVEVAEASFETTSTLLGLQSSQPFSLFELTYTGVGIGTSSLTLGSTPDILADGSGAILPNPTVGPGSITVQGTGPNPSPTPEPSTFVLLATAVGVLGSSVKRRYLAQQA
jgi:hypothetical protein